MADSTIQETQDRIAIDMIIDLIEEYSEWLEDGAGRPDDEVLNAGWIEDDPRSWQQIVREFLHEYGKRRQARVVKPDVWQGWKPLDATEEG